MLNSNLLVRCFARASASNTINCDIYTQIEQSRKLMERKSYEQQTKEYAKFLMKFAKRRNS